MKQKTVKRNSHARDVDYIPSAEDDSEDDDQQVGGSVVASKKQKRPQYIPPMSMNKVANLKKIRHMVTPNVSQKVSSTSNATKKNKTKQIVTMRDDDEDDEIFQGSRVDMEVDDVDQDDGYEDIDIGIAGRLHSNSYETGSQHESSDDDESTVGRRGPVAPTPLPEPRNREQIFIIHGEFSNQGKATRIIGETLQAFWSHPWTSWKDISKEDENRMFDLFKFMKKKVKNLLSRARNSAKKAACNANVKVGDDLSVIIPYKPRWMGSQIWEKLVEYWNTDDWKAKSSINASNRGKLIGVKHTLGSQTYVTLKRKADKLLGRPATVDEIWMQSHGKKGTRPLDKLLTSKGGERSQETGNLDEIDLQTTVKWVDTRAKDSLKSYKECVKKRYGDDASKQPLFDLDSWIQAVGGGKKAESMVLVTSVIHML
ncbi:hypothetical protein E3N88_23078 [Mikania micrantha]|uniref:Uncharacterized protein n=1 Tax=Mikania micrantha TaxID=192012 RepID=A0A5N6NDZ9_9ASTR|nr:hypothetical protein E3N88_23078 [Mikania micrantha]